MYFKNVLNALLTATLLLSSYRYPAGGHDGQNTAYHCLVNALEGDYKPMDQPSETGIHVISVYDELIRQEAKKEGLDWRLLSAIAYHESRFNPRIVSGKGARGLMQIMPSTARQFNVPEDHVMEPRINVRLAAKLLKRIERSLKLSPSTDPADKTKLILACYNGGIGHVADARRLTLKYGGDPDSWEDVATYLCLKADPEYSQDDLVTCVALHGSDQTIAFVQQVTNSYTAYCKKATL